MGVPGFFAWLLKKYKNNDIIMTNINDQVDVLYIDANCLFHPQCHKVLSYYDKKIDVDKLENKMIKRILNYIDYLIGLVNPKTEVFISVDGVAPLAKMNQQRKRRYKSVQDNEIRDNIKKKYNISSNEIWNNTVITPGTKFMEKLHNKILEYIKLNRIDLKIKYTYSSYHTTGEGEHKILQDIKHRNNSENEVYVIYGLDADLIFLAMSSRKKNIYLLREETFLRSVNKFDKEEIIDIIKDVAEDLNYVSIDEMRKSINQQIIILLEKKLEVDELENEFKYEDINLDDKDFVNDFIILCYFLGNDFIPNLPSIEIRNEGLDFLINIYTDTYLTLQCNMVNENGEEIEINNIFFEMLIENLAKYEDYYFRVKLPKYQENLKRRRCQSDDPYEIDIWKMENMRNLEFEDPIQLGIDKSDLWKYRYYEHYYGVNHYQENHINKMCEEYLKGMMWIIEYYFKKCPSFEWQYIYYHAPFISDLSKFFKSKKYDLNGIKFNNTIILDPLTQLLAVVPPSCHILLPEFYSKLMKANNSPLLDMFPIKVKIDMINKDIYHKCIPLVPNIDIRRIQNAVKNIELTIEEKERNKILENFIARH